ncbi:MAG TPA: hypothetical protein VF187_08060 [Gemmatimonadales bacterium]
MPNAAQPNDEIVSAVEELAAQLDAQQKAALKELGRQIQAAQERGGTAAVEPLLRQGMQTLRPDQRRALDALARRFRNQAPEVAKDALDRLNPSTEGA